MRDHIQLYLNGKSYKVSGEKIFWNLSRFLRHDLSLRGTKIVCEEGDCGACTVLVGSYQADGEIKYQSINSCIAMLASFDGKHIVTIEGLKRRDELHPVQESMIENNGTQCGFCTPGFVMSLVDLYENKEDVSEKTCRNYLTGNLCRCTGYASIIDSALSVDRTKLFKLSSLYNDKKMMGKNESSTGIDIHEGRWRYYSPTSLHDAIAFKRGNKKVRIISSGTDLGVLLNKGKLELDQFLSLAKIDELNQIIDAGDHISVGANITLRKLEEFYEKVDEDFSNFLQIFASPQIKNTATLIGNIANASPIGDSLPFLSVMGAQLFLQGSAGERIVNFNDFYKGYKEMDIVDDEILTRVLIPKREKHEVLKLYKVSRRRDLDISCVNAAMKISLKENLIETIDITYGGVAAFVFPLKKLSDSLVGKKFSAETFKKASYEVSNEIKPLSDVRGSSEYRMLVAKNLLQRFYLDCQREVENAKV